LRSGRRLGTARARARARPEPREPPSAPGDGSRPPARRLHRLRRPARPDPGRGGPLTMADRMEEVRDEGALRATTLPPGWDEAVDLEADPATIPDPADVEVPDELRAEVHRLMRPHPHRQS